MSSSAAEFSDNSENDIGQSQIDSQIQSSPPASASGISHPSNIQYPTLGQAAYPYPDPYYRSMYPTYETLPYPTQPYPVPPMVQVQLMGIQQAGVPLPSESVEEPVFVNAKQYHGILRRRQIRAKAESENKAHKNRKPYLHESRHLHALRRSRGCGGRFEKKDKQQKKMGSDDNSQSHVNINLNSDKT
ncbi:nuclear transcription factor Y subunit A-4-like isoform X2 [Rutidosis leptorrhynchoides]|uniref:nuclear transcription factor Y subunit A-4-like isoform X2 n=1 Tax=Rutidosis leptorrhynchoides TaxID=125765 RepID=UPI003A9951D4